RSPLVTNCPDGMTEQRTEDQWDKQGKRREWTLTRKFEQEDIKHCNPCDDRDRGGIAGAPRLVEAGHQPERHRRNKANLRKRPHGIARFNFIASLDDPLEIDRVDDHEKAKQPDILKYLGPIDPKRRNFTVRRVLYEVDNGHVGPEDR